ncbi:MAG: hypothetical protein Q9192_007038 [Flavoplaca navasiana]
MRGLAAGRGANAPLHAPVIGQPRLISSSLQTGPDNVQGRSRQANQERSQTVPPGNDPELAAQRVTEVFNWDHRTQLLEWYRENRFMGDLAVGRHEYDSYYYDLWNRISATSSQAAAALNQRIQPHHKIKFPLTIPPRYEPSDVPPYTATTSPPSYSEYLPDGHASKEVPLCLARDCPIRVYGIAHTKGQYHHEGQVGPDIQHGESYLPCFGGSNPPPNVWEAYNLMVLDVNTTYQADLVKAFCLYHSHPYEVPKDKGMSPVYQGIPDKTIVGSRKQMPAPQDRWKQDRARRIPRYSYDAPSVETGPVDMVEARLLDILNTRPAPPQLNGRLTGRNAVQRQHPATHHQHAGHRHGAIHANNARIHHAPTHLPIIGEVMDQRLLRAPLLGLQHDWAAERSIRFADEMDWEANEEWFF